MTYLLDTNVVSESRKRVPDSNVIMWLDRVDQMQLFLSVLTLGEVRKGIEMRRKHDLQGAAALQHWLIGLETQFGDHIIPIDTEVVHIWGEMSAAAPLPVVDTLIAATARAHGLTVVTRNRRDIGRTGVAVIDPWQDMPQ